MSGSDRPNSFRAIIPTTFRPLASMYENAQPVVATCGLRRTNDAVGFVAVCNGGAAILDTSLHPASMKTAETEAKKEIRLTHSKGGDRIELTPC